MSEIVVIDTSVFLNVLDVPGFNQDRDSVLRELERLINRNATLLLPMAAVVETGNHIAQIAAGWLRRSFAERFCEQVGAAITGDAPWQAMRVPDRETFASWLVEFPDAATRRLGIGDLSIIKDWEETCGLHQSRRVRIWSNDLHLSGYDRAALI